MRTCNLMLAVCLPFVLNSCYAGGRYYAPPDVTVRMVHADVWIVREGEASENSWSQAEGTTPLETAVAVGVQFSSRDYNLRRDQMISRMEIDFGDGSGWQDITQLYYVMDFDYDDGVDLSRVARHTYTQPGEYLIRARATYWDGEVVSLDENTPRDGRPQPIRVTVTEPPAAAQ